MLIHIGVVKKTRPRWSTAHSLPAIGFSIGPKIRQPRGIAIVGGLLAPQLLTLVEGAGDLPAGPRPQDPQGAARAAQGGEQAVDGAGWSADDDLSRTVIAMGAQGSTAAPRCVWAQDPTARVTRCIRDLGLLISGVPLCRPRENVGWVPLPATEATTFRWELAN